MNTRGWEHSRRSTRFPVSRRGLPASGNMTNMSSQMNEARQRASGWVQRALAKVVCMISEPDHPTGQPRDPLEEETTMFKTISAALLAVSVIAAPALASLSGQDDPCAGHEDDPGAGRQDDHRSGDQGRAVEVEAAERQCHDEPSHALQALSPSSSPQAHGYAEDPCGAEDRDQARHFRRQARLKPIRRRGLIHIAPPRQRISGPTHAPLLPQWPWVGAVRPHLWCRQARKCLRGAGRPAEITEMRIPFRRRAV